MAEGQKFLDLSATGSELTEYHVEAAIASVHAHGASHRGYRLGKIVSLYDTLMTIRPSPSLRSTAPSPSRSTKAPNAGSKRFASIANRDRLATYPFYHAALGEFEFHSGRYEIAREHFRAALALGAQSPWSDNSSSSALVRLNTRSRSVR